MSGVGEIFGLVAAISQFIDYGGATYSLISDLQKKIRDSPVSLQKEIDNLCRLERIIEDINFKSIANSDELMNICQDFRLESKDLINLLRGLIVPSKNGRYTKKERIPMGIRWKQREKEINQRMERIKNARENLMLCIGVDPYTKKASIASELLTGLTPTTMTVGRTKPICNLPQRDLKFTGQREYLRKLSEKLNLPNVPQHRAAVVGLGGSGKSALVVEAVHRLRESLPELSVFWMRASSEQELEQSFVELEAALELPEIPGTKKPTPLKVVDYLESKHSGEWLIVFDNANDPQAFFGGLKLGQMIPQNSKSKIIFTSQNKKLMLDIVGHSIVTIEKMEVEDAKELLIIKSGGRFARAEDMLDLLSALDWLALAITQAAAFMAINSMTVAEYLSLYQESEANRIDLLRTAGSYGGEYGYASPKSCIATWLLSLKRIRRENPFSFELLAFMACLNPHRIPKILLPSSKSPITFVGGLGTLKAYSLIKSDTNNDTFDVHPLIHLVTRELLREEHQFDKYLHLGHDTVLRLLPLVLEGKADLQIAQKLLPHAQSLLDETTLPSLPKPTKGVPSLATAISRCLQAQGNYRTALRYAQMGSEQARITFGDCEPEYLSAVTETGICYQGLGDFESAGNIFNAVLKSRETALGQEHPDTLDSQHQFARSLHLRGKYQEAEDKFISTLALKRQTLGEEHVETLKTLSNLGITFQCLKRYAAAEEALRQVEVCRKRELGPLNISTLTSVSNLGTILQVREQWDAAFEKHMEAYEGRAEVLGPQHPETLKSRANLATVLQGLGKHGLAEEMERQILDEHVQLLGANHPESLSMKSNLALMLHHQGRFREAESCSREVFEARTIKLGPSHPDTISSGKHADDLADWLREYGHTVPVENEADEKEDLD